MKIYLDMDGTFVNLYGVEGWLAYLQALDPTPYKQAKGLVNLSNLARLLNRAQALGHEIYIVSWLAKHSTAEYDRAVSATKQAWLEKHLKSVKFNGVYILPYGTPKSTVITEGATAILFDDEERNRTEWADVAIEAEGLLSVLLDICRQV